MLAKSVCRGAFLSIVTLLASCGGGGGSSSDDPPVTVPGMPIFVATQPVGGVVGAPLTTQPVVQLHTEAGRNTADNTTVVTVSIATGTGTVGATLTGTKTATAVAGIVTFTNLGIDTAGTGYQLRFTSSQPSMYYASSSAAFTITAPPVRRTAPE